MAVWLFDPSLSGLEVVREISRAEGLLAYVCCVGGWWIRMCMDVTPLQKHGVSLILLSLFTASVHLASGLWLY